ncbi:MAG TPA: endolytic transglycosylase MltG [Steroidobacteraceae bacterium]|nr:endolytic transglycosylase MltG [Steroidobacteraceae bacterium]
MRRGRAVFIVLSALVILAAAAGYARVSANFRAPGPSAAAVDLKVSPGESTRAALAGLAGLGAVAHPREVELYLRLHRRNPRLEIGTYQIPAHASPADIIRRFEEGRVLLEPLTVVPGATFADFRRELDASPDVAHTLRGRSDDGVMAALGHPGQNPEGRFFPDTYRFAPGTSDLTILAMAYDRMAAVLAKVWQQRSAGLPFDTPYQALILASVVEKETGVADERGHIAGVFINRLRRGMRLQSDPTVIYGLGSRYDGKIHTRDLTTDTPYNSYTRSGLPPTPISLPGLESLLAAVHPDDTQDLYFVATGQGGHHFSKTLAQHDAELRAYLARLREQQQAAARRQGAGKP